MGKTEQVIFANGERYPMLVDGYNSPDYWMTLYVTVNLRPRLSQSAITNIIRDIKHLKLFEEINQRDLHLEISTGKFLSDTDIINIRDHCMLETRGLKKWIKHSHQQNIASYKNLRKPKNDMFCRVTSAHMANRILHIADYLTFTANTMLRIRSNFVELSKQIDHTKTRLLAQKPKSTRGGGMGNDPDQKAPDPQTFDIFMASVSDLSHDNPYKNPTIRIRNALMFELLYETGIRSGELLALRIEDVDFHFHKLHIKRRHDDLLDPRGQQPVVKTLERSIPIKMGFVLRLRKYIMEVRSITLGANKHPFLFVTHHSGKYQGRPLSDSTFRNRILRTATKKNPELFNQITRHGFRHNFNYRLSKKIDDHNKRAKTDLGLKPISEKEEIQIRKQLNGWSSDDTAQIYNLRHIKELADKLLREDINEQAQHIR